MIFPFRSDFPCTLGANDQHVYNLLLGSSAYQKITKFSSHSDGWAALLGTTIEEAEQSTEFAKHLLDSKPVLVDGEVLTADKSKKFVIVHQYDRMESWVKQITKKLAEKTNH